MTPIEYAQLSSPDLRYISTLPFCSETEIQEDTGSMQGNCSDSDPAAALNLAAADASDLLPLRPFQCLIVVNETWLMVNDGRVLVDNLYLKLSRTAVRPSFAYITAGALNGELQWPGIKRSTIYVTGTTFQAEHRGNSRAFIADVTGGSFYVDGTRVPLSLQQGSHILCLRLGSAETALAISDACCFPESECEVLVACASH